MDNYLYMYRVGSAKHWGQTVAIIMIYLYLLGVCVLGGGVCGGGGGVHEVEASVD